MRNENSKKESKEMLEIKNMKTKMENALDWLINRLVQGEERISQLEDMSIETSNSENKKERKKKNWEKE